MKTLSTPLFIFEMANNHMGDVEHGIRIVREFKEVARDFDFKFSIKLQHRSDSFFHPDFVGRMDYKYIKRFTETKLSKDDFRRLKDEIQNCGFVSMCTPWDEPSVDLMDELAFDVIKIASCSFTDWPLLERVVRSEKPVIISTAGATLEEIDQVVSFFTHRSKEFAVLHCVGEYPCKRDHLELNQIDFFQKRYSGVPIGYSTHEDPENFDSIRVAIGLGARIFEKHIGVPTDKYALNAYSATPAQARKWLQAAADSFVMCGVQGRRKDITTKEMDDLIPLFRGAFASRDIKKGEKLGLDNLFLAMPNKPGQLVARQMSKYTEYRAERDFAKNEAVMLDALSKKELRSRVTEIVNRLRSLLRETRTALPPFVNLEISHHYGIERFDEWGAILINIINRAYSKMLVVMFPGQSYPRHAHREKEETYHLLHGELIVEVEGRETTLRQGDVLSIPRGAKHSFRTTKGAIVEEIATMYLQGDSIYEDPSINANKERKTQLTFWPQWMSDSPDF